MASSLQQYRQELENRNLPSDLIDRMVRSRQKSTRDVALQSGLGERIFDRILGGTSAAGYTIAGGLSDLAGGLGGFLGGPFTEDAATLKEFADEAYRRAKPLALEGYKQGSVTASKNAVPMIDLPFYSETEMLANLQDKINSPEYLGEFGGLDSRNYNIDAKPIPKLSEQEMANVFSEVEGKSDLYRQLAEIEARAKDKKIPDVDFIDPSLAEANKEQTRISQAKAKEEEALSAQEESFDQPSTDEDPTETAFMDAMKQFIADSGKQDVAVKGETKKQKLDRYKKEFEDVTGIDASGKVDKSRTLMAFGLKLMQNRAGPGFNLGKIFREVGEAGEAAMPQLDKAIERANAAKLAAGKYALQQIQSDEDASAAIAAEDKAFQRERYFKLLELQTDIDKEKIKAGAKVGEIKNVKVDKVINGLEVQRGRGSTGAVFAFPTDALRDSAGALKSINGALSTVDQMTELLTQIDSEQSPTFQLIADSVNTALVGAGLADANVVFGDSKVGKRQQVRLLQDSIITQFKRMLTQETGNGISKSDVDNIKTMLGNIDLLGNPQESILRLKEIKTLFAGKRSAVRGVLDELQDIDNYPTESEYNKNMELYPSLLIDNKNQYSTTMSNEETPRVQVKDD